MGGVSLRVRPVMFHLAPWRATVEVLGIYSRPVKNRGLQRAFPSDMYGWDYVYAGATCSLLSGPQELLDETGCIGTLCCDHNS